MGKGNFCVRIEYVNGKAVDLYFDSKEDADNAIENLSFGMSNRCAVAVHDDLIVNANNVLYVERM